MREAIASYKKVADADDPAIVDLERYLRRLNESEQSQEHKSGEIEKKKDVTQTDTLKEERDLTEKEELSEKEKSPDAEGYTESDEKTPLRKSRKTGRPDNSFEIISVDCKEEFKFDKKNKDTEFPSIIVTYRLHTTKKQANWTERLDVICPDGTMIY